MVIGGEKEECKVFTFSLKLVFHSLSPPPKFSLRGSLWFRTDKQNSKLINFNLWVFAGGSKATWKTFASKLLKNHISSFPLPLKLFHSDEISDRSFTLLENVQLRVFFPALLFCISFWLLPIFIFVKFMLLGKSLKYFRFSYRNVFKTKQLWSLFVFIFYSPFLSRLFSCVPYCFLFYFIFIF